MVQETLVYDKNNEHPLKKYAGSFRKSYIRRLIERNNKPHKTR